MKPAIEVLDIRREELNALLEHARTALPEQDYLQLKALIEGLNYLTELIADKDTTIRDLRQLLFPLVNEKTREVLKRAGIASSAKAEELTNAAAEKPNKPGHGRNGAHAYGGAERVVIAHAGLHRGDICPGCEKGKVYEQQEPKRLVRITGQAPIGATVYEFSGCAAICAARFIPHRVRKEWARISTMSERRRSSR